MEKRLFVGKTSQIWIEDPLRDVTASSSEGTLEDTYDTATVHIIISIVLSIL